MRRLLIALSLCAAAWAGPAPARELAPCEAAPGCAVARPPQPRAQTQPRVQPPPRVQAQGRPQERGFVQEDPYWGERRRRPREPFERRLEGGPAPPVCVTEFTANGPRRVCRPAPRYY
jgi:hypothetical protein